MFSRSLKASAVAALLTLSGAAVQAVGVSVTISCGTVGQDFDSCKKAADEWSAKTGNTVKHLTIPQSTSDVLGLFRQMFAAESADLDVLNIDVVWPGILKEHLLDLTPFSHGAENEHFPAIVANNTGGGKLLAMPWFTDAGVLYYRKDLLAKYGDKPPATWDELGATAKKVMDGERKAGNGDMRCLPAKGLRGPDLTSAAVQKDRAIRGSYNPTIPALYKDAEVLKANPFFGDLYDTFVGAVPRPATVTGAKYNEVSAAFWNAAHDVLAGNPKPEGEPEEARRQDRFDPPRPEVAVIASRGAGRGPVA